MQADPFEDVSIFRIADNHVLKADPAFQLFWAMVRYLSVNHFRGLVEHFLNALSTGYSVTRKVGQLREITHRLVQHLKIGEEQDQRPDIDSGCVDRHKTEGEA